MLRSWTLLDIYLFKQLFAQYTYVSSSSKFMLVVLKADIACLKGERSNEMRTLFGAREILIIWYDPFMAHTGKGGQT